MRVRLLLPALLLFPAGLIAQQRRGDAGRLPQPRTALTGPVLEFDFPGLLIGSAEYDEGPTGVTVFHFPAGAATVVDVRGGAPGTVNSDALRLGYAAQMRAIVLSGGSWQGLSAVAATADAIRAQHVERGEAPRIVGVVGAIVNDLGIGAGVRRFANVTPDTHLAEAAVRSAVAGRFHVGARGAGRFVMTGGAVGQREFSGQGGAFRQVGPTKIAVFTIVNAAGLVVDRQGRIARCIAMRWGESCGTINDFLAGRVDSLAARNAQRVSSAASDAFDQPTGNTTITLVVTNQKLELWALQRLAAQVHTSMARAIQPFATASDGDVLYAVTTAEVDNAQLSTGELNLLASELAWDAVLASVPAPDPRGPSGVISLEPRLLDTYIGEYVLGPGARVTLRREGEGLVAESARGGQYFPAGAARKLVAVGRNEFVLETARRDRLRFDLDSRGRVTGLTINPGHWELKALPAQRP